MYLIFAALILITIILFLVYLKYIKRFDFNNFDKTIKILSIIYCVIIFINLFLPDGFAREYTDDVLKKKDSIFENFIRWFQNTTFIVLPLVAFYKNKILTKIASFVVLPFNIIYLFSYNIIIKSLTDKEGRGLNTIRFVTQDFKNFMTNEIFRTILFSIIMIIAISTLLLVTFKNIDDLKFNKKEIKYFILGALGIILLALPVYTPQYFFGYTDIIFKRFSLSHFVVIAFIILEIIFLYYVLKNQPEEIKMIVLIAMSLSLLFQFNQVFTGTNEVNFKKLPLQLCNIGSYLMLFTLISKNKHLFNFSIVINVVGATIAMIILDVSNVGIGYYWNVHYILEHGKVIIIPLLTLLLKIFSPLTKKEIKDIFIGFTLYFLFVLYFGTLANALYYSFDNSYFKVNYLFMFIQEETSAIVSFVEPLFDIKLNFFTLTLYPVVQLLVYIIFTSLCCGCFYILYFFTNRKKKTI